jgi:hypothetical protein
MKNEYGLVLTGMVASSKVITGKKKDGSEWHKAETVISDGETSYKHQEFLLSPELAQNFAFGAPVRVRVDYTKMGDDRTITVGGKLEPLEQSARKTA